MASFQYTAERSLITGHTAGVDYELIMPLSQSQEIDKRKGRVVTSLGGRFEYQHDRVEEYLSVTTIPFRSTSLAAVQEFLKSVNQGEPFLIDQTGTLASPGLARWTALDGDYRINMIDKSGIYQASFRLKL